jgi:hypothetical protein
MWPQRRLDEGERRGRTKRKIETEERKRMRKTKEKQ